MKIDDLEIGKMYYVVYDSSVKATICTGIDDLSMHGSPFMVAYFDEITGYVPTCDIIFNSEKEANKKLKKILKSILVIKEKEFKRLKEQYKQEKEEIKNKIKLIKL